MPGAAQQASPTVDFLCSSMCFKTAGGTQQDGPQPVGLGWEWGVGLGGLGTVGSVG